MPSERFSVEESLSAFRGLAALLVSLGHLEQIFVRPYSKSFSPYAGLLAQASVMVFFVISGYSITASITGLINKPYPYYEYFLKRFCRLMPPLILAIFLMYVLFVLAPYFFPNGTHNFVKQPDLSRPGFNVDISLLAGALFFINGFLTATPETNGPLWSLSYEAWLYAIFFAVYYSFTKNTKTPFILASVFYLLLTFLDKSGNWFFFKYSFIWFAGAACKIIFQLNPTTLCSYARLIKILFVISLCIILYMSYRYIKWGMKIDISAFNICVGISFSFFLLTNFNKSIIKKNLVFRFLVKAAGFSYTLYLIHCPFYLFIFGATQSQSIISLDILCMTYLLSVLLAYLFAQFVENRAFFLNLMRTYR